MILNKISKFKDLKFIEDYSFCTPFEGTICTDKIFGEYFILDDYLNDTLSLNKHSDDMYVHEDIICHFDLEMHKIKKSFLNKDFENKFSTKELENIVKSNFDSINRFFTTYKNMIEFINTKESKFMEIFYDLKIFS